jgi:hypothetical protein
MTFMVLSANIMGKYIQHLLLFCFMILENQSITKSVEQRSLFYHTIFDLPGAAVKTFFAERQESKHPLLGMPTIGHVHHPLLGMPTTGHANWWAHPLLGMPTTGHAH